MKTYLPILIVFIGIVSPLGAQETIWNLKVGNKFVYETRQVSWLGVLQYSIKEVVAERTINGKRYAVVRYKSYRENGNPLDEDSISIMRAQGFNLYSWSEPSNEEFLIFSDRFTSSTFFHITTQKDTVFGVPVNSYFSISSVSGAVCQRFENYSSTFGKTEKGLSCWRAQNNIYSSLCAALIDGKIYGDSSKFLQFASVSSAPEISLALAPNPFVSDLTISWNQSGEAEIEILDVLGRIMRQFHVRPYEQFRWDGTDNNGLAVNIGLYWLRIKTATTLNVIKILKTP